MMLDTHASARSTIHPEPCGKLPHDPDGQRNGAIPDLAVGRSA